ncbi:hypothetical protein D3C87_1877710 [compost metagenome]
MVHVMLAAPAAIVGVLTIVRFTGGVALVVAPEVAVITPSVTLTARMFFVAVAAPAATALGMPFVPELQPASANVSL